MVDVSLGRLREFMGPLIEEKIKPGIKIWGVPVSVAVALVTYSKSVTELFPILGSRLPKALTLAVVGLVIGLVWVLLTRFWLNREQHAIATVKIKLREQWHRWRIARASSDVDTTQLEDWYRENDQVDLPLVQQLWGKRYATCTIPADPAHKGRYYLENASTVEGEYDKGSKEKIFKALLTRYGGVRAPALETLFGKNRKVHADAKKLHIWRLFEYGRPDQKDTQSDDPNATKPAKPIHWDAVNFAVRRIERDASGFVSALATRPCSYLQGTLSGAELQFQLMTLESVLHQKTPYRGIPHAWASLYGTPKEEASPAVAPLLTVQGITIFRESRNDPWLLLGMTRAEHMDAGAMRQLPPAGGCEVYWAKPDAVTLGDELDARISLQREFLEEVYGDIELGEHASEKSRETKGVRETRKLFMQAAPAHPGGDGVHFLGTVIEPYSLRAAMTFLIVVQSEALLNLEYEVAAGKDTGKARFMKGSLENKQMNCRPLTDAAGCFSNPKYNWHATSVGAMKLLADLTQDANSWLRQLYPDLPVLDYSSKEPGGLSHAA